MIPLGPFFPVLEEDNGDPAFGVPPVTGIVFIPGNVAFLNQFFSVILMVSPMRAAPRATVNSSRPARSLVMGSPGRVKRELTAAEVASILEYSERYVGYRLDYMAS